MENKLIDCSCGCGQRIEEWYTRKRGKYLEYAYKRRFAPGHNSRGKLNPMYGRPGWNKGKRLTDEHRAKISKANIGRAGQKGPDNYFYGKSFAGSLSAQWKGGRFQWWRKAVLERDKYTCQTCGLHDPEIMQADHIKPKKQFPDLVWDLGNGRALCPNCHERKSLREKEKGRRPA